MQWGSVMGWMRVAAVVSLPAVDKCFAALVDKLQCEKWGVEVCMRNIKS